MGESFDERLIDAVKKRPVLYDTKAPDYMNCNRKQQVWQEIGKELTTSDEEIKKRWKSLRDRYTRERKASKVTGAETDITQKWPLYNNISFLSDHIRHKAGTSRNSSQSDPSTNLLELGELETNSSNDGSNASESALSASRDSNNDLVVKPWSSPKKRRVKDVQMQLLQEMADLRNATREYSSSELYCLSVAKRLDAMSKRNQASARMRIEQILFELEFLDKR